MGGRDIIQQNRIKWTSLHTKYSRVCKRNNHKELAGSRKIPNLEGSAGSRTRSKPKFTRIGFRTLQEYDQIHVLVLITQGNSIPWQPVLMLGLTSREVYVDLILTE